VHVVRPLLLVADLFRRLFLPLNLDFRILDSPLDGISAGQVFISWTFHNSTTPQRLYAVRSSHLDFTIHLESSSPSLPQCPQQRAIFDVYSAAIHRFINRISTPYICGPQVLRQTLYLRWHRGLIIQTLLLLNSNDSDPPVAHVLRHHLRMRLSIHGTRLNALSSPIPTGFERTRFAVVSSTSTLYRHPFLSITREKGPFAHSPLPIPTRTSTSQATQPHNA
jgi:hypothetical protein